MDQNRFLVGSHSNEPKTLSIFNRSSMERGKALSESLSSGYRDQINDIRKKRAERYEEMIQEDNREVESPMNRLHR